MSIQDLAIFEQFCARCYGKFFKILGGWGKKVPQRDFLLASNSDHGESSNLKTLNFIEINKKSPYCEKMPDFDFYQSSCKQMNFQELVSFESYPMGGNESERGE